MRDNTKPPNLTVNEFQSSPLPLSSGDVPCDKSLTLVLGCPFTPLLTEIDKGTQRTVVCLGEVTSRQGLLK